MPGIDIHTIPHPRATGTAGIGLTTANIDIIITTANKPDQNLLNSQLGWKVGVSSQMPGGRVRYGDPVAAGVSPAWRIAADTAASTEFSI